MFRQVHFAMSCLVFWRLKPGIVCHMLWISCNIGFQDVHHGHETELQMYCCKIDMSSMVIYNPWQKTLFIFNMKSCALLEIIWNHFEKNGNVWQCLLMNRCQTWLCCCIGSKQAGLDCAGFHPWKSLDTIVAYDCWRSFCFCRNLDVDNVHFWPGLKSDAILNVAVSKLFDLVTHCNTVTIEKLNLEYFGRYQFGCIICLQTPLLQGHGGWFKFGTWLEVRFMCLSLLNLSEGTEHLQFK